MCKCNQISSTVSKEQSQKVLMWTKFLKAPNLNASGKGICQVKTKLLLIVLLLHVLAGFVLICLGLRYWPCVKFSVT